MSTPVMPSRTERRSISPRARRALNLHRLDISQINGSGPNGRVVEADVLHLMKNPKEQIAPKLASSRATFSLRMEIDASALLGLETRSQISSSKWIERALSRAGSTPGAASESPHCVFQESKSKYADEFRPSLPHDVYGVLGAGRIEKRPFVMNDELRICPTLHLYFCGEESQRESLQQIFDLTIEILEDPILLIFL